MCPRNICLKVVLVFALMAQAPLSVYAGPCENTCQAIHAAVVQGCADTQAAEVAAAAALRTSDKGSCETALGIQMAAATAAFILCVSLCPVCGVGCAVGYGIADAAAIAAKVACDNSADTNYAIRVDLANDRYAICVGTAQANLDICINACSNPGS